VAVQSFGSERWATPPPLAWSALAYSGLGSIVLGNVFWFTAVNHLGAARSSLYANLQPFLGAIFGLLVLSEDLSRLQLAGGLVIASSIVLGRGAPLPTPPAD
jgi:drug/metabolite transporter (DMT)-like permease